MSRGPCLCGDPECWHCFPFSAAESKRLRLLDEAGRLCDHCQEEIQKRPWNPQERKTTWEGRAYHRNCLLKAFEQRRKQGRVA